MQTTFLGLYDTIYENEDFLVLFLLPESCCCPRYWFLSLIIYKILPKHMQKIFMGWRIFRYTVYRTRRTHWWKNCWWIILNCIIIKNFNPVFNPMATHQNVRNLKQMRDIFVVTKLPKYLTRYAHLNQYHS